MACGYDACAGAGASAPRLTAPWLSLDTRERLLWVAKHAEAGELWMPTAADLNAAIRADNAESIENAEAAQWTRKMAVELFR